MAVPSEEEIHFRDQFRSARALALRDAENFEDLVFVLERLGAIRVGVIGALGDYETELEKIAIRSPLGASVAQNAPTWHAAFSVLYSLARTARNDAVHQGALARHLTGHLVELALILEDALMSEATKVRDFMVKEVVSAAAWQPVSFVRQTMLANSFSFLPIFCDRGGGARWWFISDHAVARYLRAASSNGARTALLLTPVGEANLVLSDAVELEPETEVGAALGRMGSGPAIVVDPKFRDHALGIVTAFDVL